jgi:catechol 2,3-dioxygenase
MEVVHRGPSAVYLRGYGDYAASTLRLTESAKPGVGCISWRAMSPAALERRARAIEAEGLGIGWSHGDFGRGRSYRFHDPDGHLMDIYYEEHKYVASPQLRSRFKNRPQKYIGRRVGVRRIDHLALLAADVPENRALRAGASGLSVA